MVNNAADAPGTRPIGRARRYAQAGRLDPDDGFVP
jgi:hypothetical protein